MTPSDAVTVGCVISDDTVLTSDQVEKCVTIVDEVWVPARFMIDVFLHSGVPDMTKLVYIPEPVDVHLFDPAITTSLPQIENLKLHPWIPPDEKDELFDLPQQQQQQQFPQEEPFKFLSIFKWEKRKGPDLLLRAYFHEFSWHQDSHVCLVLLTYLYGSSQPRNREAIERVIMNDIVNSDPELHRRADAQDLPCVEIIVDELPETDMPKLYKSADAFVLPTRGEGFGLPIAEAMSMGLPTIATNFSGPTDFMTDWNSFPLQVDRTILADEYSDAVKDEYLDVPKWAEPSVGHLRQLMRHVVKHHHDPAQHARGQRARSDIIANYSPEYVTEVVLRRLRAIRLHLDKEQRR